MRPFSITTLVFEGMKCVALMDPRPLISVVDDDVSVRESFELLIKFEDWQADPPGIPGTDHQTFGNAQRGECMIKSFDPGEAWGVDDRMVRCAGREILRSARRLK